MIDQKTAVEEVVDQKTAAEVEDARLSPSSPPWSWLPGCSTAPGDLPTTLIKHNFGSNQCFKLGIKSLCILPDQNMSLASLGENDYYTAENRDDKTVIYLSLCHPLR